MADNRITRCFIDVETSGLNAMTNGIVQISGIIEQGSRELEFDFKCSPIDGDVIEPSALEANRRTEDEIRNFPSPTIAHDGMMEMFGSFVNKFARDEKMFFIAYNAKFDEEFMRAWMKKLNDHYYGSWFWTPSICVMVLAGQYLMDKRHSMSDFKQITVARALGIDCDESKAHNSMYDVRIARGIYNIVNGNRG